MSAYSHPASGLTLHRTSGSAPSKYAAAGGKTFGRPVERLRTSVVRGARKWRVRSDKTHYQIVDEQRSSSPAEFIPLLPLRHRTAIPPTPTAKPNIARTARPMQPAGGSTGSMPRSLRRKDSGFFRPPQSRRWRRTRKFAKFLLVRRFLIINIHCTNTRSYL